MLLVETLTAREGEGREDELALHGPSVAVSCDDHDVPGRWVQILNREQRLKHKIPKVKS